MEKNVSIIIPVYNEEEKQITVFAVNRSLTDAMELTISLQDFGDVALLEHICLDGDLNATNTADNAPVKPASVAVSDKISLPPHSFNMLRFACK